MNSPWIGKKDQVSNIGLPEYEAGANRYAKKIRCLCHGIRQYVCLYLVGR